MVTNKLDLKPASTAANETGELQIPTDLSASGYSAYVDLSEHLYTTTKEVELRSYLEPIATSLCLPCTRGPAWAKEGENERVHPTSPKPSANNKTMNLPTTFLPSFSFSNPASASYYKSVN